jgi:3-phenylpropionate/cinnamic acid dioxygenase small subunit
MDIKTATDIIEIQSLLARYVYAIDDKDFDQLDTVFTSDAEIDYTATGGVRGQYAQIKPWLARALAGFPRTQHLIGLPLITLQGDTARARTMLFNPMQPASGPLFFCGATYADELVRTPQGWRITRRTETDAWFKNPPEGGIVPPLEE